MNWRDFKRKARRTLHDTMGVPAYFIPQTGSEPYSITVRGPFYSKDVRIGDIEGSRQSGWAQMEVQDPMLILDRKAFDALNLIPLRDTLISIEEAEVYRIQAVLPEDDEWFYVRVVRLDKDDALLHPYPGSE